MPDIFYSGDRGSGKTTALVLRFCALLDQGVAPQEIQVLSGQHYRSVQHFKSLLFQHHGRGLWGLRIHTHRHLARQVFEYAPPDTGSDRVLSLNPSDLILLLQQNKIAGV